MNKFDNGSLIGDSKDTTWRHMVLTFFDNELGCFVTLEDGCEPVYWDLEEEN